MPVIYHSASQTFHLYNPYYSYIIKLLPDGIPGQLYFGPPLAHRENFDSLLELRDRPLQVNCSPSWDCFSLDSVKLEYPCAGTTDFRRTALEAALPDGSRTLEPRYLRHEITLGKPPLPGLPATYVEEGSEADTLTLVLLDEPTGLQITLRYTVFANHAALARSVSLKNTGAAPLTLTRLLVSGLGSAEAVLIPNRLAAYGYSTATSLSIYGIFTGMAMPLVLFPTAVTAAVSVLLLPTVAKAQSSHRHAQISRTIYATVKCCLLLGIFCFGIFLTYGKEIGIFLFGNALAGEFLRILSWLCPFLYLSSALSSILNGLGKTFAVFRNQMASLAIRIAFVVFFIPLFGIQGCLWGLLGSQLFLSLAGLAALRPFMDFPFPAYDWIARPCFYLFLSVGLSLAVTPLAEPLASLSPLLPLCVRIAAAGAAYVLLLSCAEIIRLYKSRQLRQNSI